jgi:ubiquinol-cytochrome c reductase cytochrome b subunit
MKDAVACLIVLAVVLYFVRRNHGAELSAPADAAEEYPARPEWYFLFLFRFLKYEWVEEHGLAFGAIYVPGIAMGIIALMPILGKARVGHWFNIAFTFVLTIGAGYLTGIAMDEDLKDVEFQAKHKFAHRDAQRVVELAEREGIPPLGARELMANDPYTQGPRLFARHCSGCHRYDSHDGMYLPKLRYLMDEHGKNIVEKGQKKFEIEQPTAADLGKFGSREWMQAVLTDYHNAFKPIADALQTPEETMKPQQKQAIEDLNAKKKRFLEDSAGMADWSKNNKDKLQDPANGEGYKALVEFLVAQSGREDLKADEKLVKQGREVFTTGKLVNGSIAACTDCHTMKVRGEAEAVNENSGSGVPTLTGYASKEWLTAFLKNPGHADFYGDNNIMPGFESTMTDKELGMLVDWMVGDYYRSETHQAH